MDIGNAKAAIMLTTIFGLQDHTMHRFIKQSGSAEAAFQKLLSGDEKIDLPADVRQQMKRVDYSYPDKLLNYCEKYNISICTEKDPEYPKLLKMIYDPPAVLFYRGDLSCLDQLTLTFVGAREASDYILRLCARISRDVSSCGVTLVSGMANGVDYAVHNACVNNMAPTVGVLACGIDVDYPLGRAELKEKIIATGGAYMTEFLPGTRVDTNSFRARNRILAGLSRGTVVFQAAKISGSLMTVNYAIAENRDVFCVPPPDISSPDYVGVKELIREGAIIVFNHIDILKEYVGLYLK